MFPPIIKALIDTYGWRGTFVMIGGIYAHGAVLGSLFAPIKPKQKKSRDVINSAIIDVNETNVDELDFNILKGMEAICKIQHTRRKKMELSHG